MIRATYEVEPPGSAAALAVQASTGMAGQWPHAAGRVVHEGEGRAIVEFPTANWEGNVTLLFSALVAGEATEMAVFDRCRLVDLDLPDGFLPGPRFGAPPDFGVRVGLIIKPSLGLSPAEAGEVAAAAVSGGARFIKDDEMLGDPPYCPLVERVREVAKGLDAGTVYCANVNGPPGTLVERARRAIDLGATGVLVNPFAQGLAALVELREAGVGVPILAHRAGSGPLARNEKVGASGAVLARLLRLCGADYVIAGGFGGKLFETDDEVRANIAALRQPCGAAAPSVAVVGGAVGPDNAAAQVEAAGGSGVVVVLGSRAYGHPDGIESAVRQVAKALT